jgi:release factor glutamine methyltransferase
VKVHTLQQLSSQALQSLERGDLYPLLSHAIGKPKEFILTHPGYVPTPCERKRWERCARRRMEGEPVAYIVGSREFYSLTFRVTPHTLIPRPETELMVDEAIRRKPSSLLDVGTGAGNIAVSVKYHLRSCRVAAADVSERALRVARRNARELLGSDELIFYRSDFFSNIPAQRFDIVASNPPYIRIGRFDGLQPEVRDWEPRRALDGGQDGLAAYRTILREGGRYLNTGGSMLLEVDPDILDGLLSLESAGLYRVERLVKDYAGFDRLLILARAN